MPLSTDTQTLETSHGLANALRGAQGSTVSKSFRPAHAKGHLLTGTFTPTSRAASLSSAPHFALPSTPLTARFSSSTGLPTIPDTDPTANPRGLALRFHLPAAPDGTRRHTDIITHSTPSFPTRTGAEFLALLQALGAGGDAVPEFLAEHPETVRFLETPKPSPVSFGTERYFGVNAYVFTNAQGKETVVRYRVEPVAGVQTVPPAELPGLDANYLFDELEPRLAGGPVVFKLAVQVAEEGDVTDNATVVWPEEREVVELGEIRIEKRKGEEESLREQKDVIFDPVPRVEGVGVSADPILNVRANVYLITGRERREAEVTKA
jgi:catalase